MVAALDDRREWLVDPFDGGRWFGLGVGRNGGRLFRWGWLDGRCNGIGGEMVGLMTGRVCGWLQWRWL
jgi:hypothetical protein